VSNARQIAVRLLAGAGLVLALVACERELPPAASNPIPAIDAATAPDPNTAGGDARTDGELTTKPGSKPEVINEVYPAKTPPAAPVTEVRSEAAGDLNVSFQNAGLQQVLRVILGDLLRLNYVLPPGLQGQVTLRTPRGLTRAQMLRFLDQILAAHGLVAVHEAETTRVLLAAGATAGVGRLGAGAPGYGMEAIALRYVGAEQMKSLLTPVLAEGRVLLSDPALNMVVLAGTQDERDAARRTVRVFDVDQMAGQSVALIGLQHADAETVIGELQQLFGDGVQGALGGLVRFVPVKRMNAVMAIARQRDYLDQAREWVGRLDRTRDADERRLFVYFVKNGASADLVKTLRGAFGEGLEPPSGQTAQREGQSDQAAPVPTGTTASTAPRFMADAASNALLVWATKREYDTIAEVLAKIDISPLQVLIEGTVIEITLRDQLRYGLQYFLEVGDVSSVLTRGTSTTSVTPDVPGFGVTIEGSNNSKLVIDALSELTDVRVVSSPQLLVVDGKPARLHVGDQVPIVTRSSSTAVTDDTRVVNEIEYRDTGVTLQVTPKVKSSGLVSLDILQEVSQVVRTDTSDIDSPTIQQRRIHSTAAIDDGSTVLLAGLIRERDNDLESGIPVLHEIPVLGKLFGSTDSTRQRTELIVLISPRVVRGAGDARTVTRDLLQRYQGVLDSVAPKPDTAPTN